MDIYINREGSVPLQDQICAQVGQLVASGVLESGRRLPSVRGLAVRLGIHPQTVMAAYRTLAARGVLDIREGSGVKVANLASAGGGWREGLALRAMAAYFVGQARARGHDEVAIAAACRAALAPAKTARIVVVNPHPDLQDLYLHELGRELDLPMQGLTPDEVEAMDVSTFGDACMLTSTNFAAALQRTLGEEQAPVIFKLASAEPLLARARALPADALVAVVSGTARYRFLVQELLAGVLDAAQLIESPLDDEERLRAALRLSALVVTDSASHAQVVATTNTAVYLHRLLAPDVFVALADRLPLEAFRPGGSAG